MCICVYIYNIVYIYIYTYMNIYHESYPILPTYPNSSMVESS